MWNWYYERMSPLGRWAPQISLDRPAEKGTEGRVKLRNIREISETDKTLPWRDLIKKYGTVDGVPAASTTPTFKPTHQHVRTNGLYRMTGEGRLEVTGDDAYPLVEYENEAGEKYAQRAERFHDGRFQALPSHSGE